jgi:hypothetical protein
MTDKEIEDELDRIRRQICSLYDKIDELENREIELKRKFSPDYQGFYTRIL